jgi:hypothetical protein
MTISTLRKFSISYLLLPNLLFAVGWFKPIIGWPMVVGLSYMLFLEWKKKDHFLKLNLMDLFRVGVLTCICVFFCGVDGISSQGGDWLAHNEKFYDLFKNEWPTYFPEIGQYACYYFGYYLVPSLFSKMYGELLPSVLVLWTFVGYALGISWIYLLLDKSVIAILVFFLIKGIRQLATILLLGARLILPSDPIFNLTIRSLFEQGDFATNQLIPMLISTSLLLFDFLNNKRIERSFFMITLLFVWAIFPALTLLLIYVVLVIQNYLHQRLIPEFNFKSIATTYLIPGSLLVPTLLFFLSSQNASVEGLSGNRITGGQLSFGYFVGLAIELVLFYIIFYRLSKISVEFPKWLPNILLAGLCILALFRIGKYNDSFYRGSIPFCVMLFILMMRSLVSVYRNRRWSSLYSISFFLLILALLAAVGLVKKRGLFRDNKIANFYLGERSSYNHYGYNKFPNIYQTLIIGYKDETGAKQYLCKKGSWFERHLCKRPVR